MAKEDEMILVVNRDVLPPVQNGIVIPDTGNLDQIVVDHGEFMRRGSSKEPADHPLGNAEMNLHYKQIIPYLVVEHQGDEGVRYFSARRLATTDERRLAERVKLGFGGHLNKDDVAGRPISEWWDRELRDELIVDGDVTDTETVGMINDDETDPVVNPFHFGYVVRLRVNTDRIFTKEPDQDGEGKWSDLKGLQGAESAMESWSQIVFQHLMKQAQGNFAR